MHTHRNTHTDEHKDSDEYSIVGFWQKHNYNKVDSMLVMGVVRPSTLPYVWPMGWLRRNMVLTGCVLTLGS